MTDETVRIQPAIPSRAATVSPFKSNPLDLPGSGYLPPRPPARKRPKKKAKKAKTLSPAEIKKINAKRKKNIEKDVRTARRRLKKPKTTMQIVRAAPRETGRAKNPNRPLEMKNQLSAVLSMVGTLQKAELVFFSQAVPAMQALSRSGRKRVIAALQQVYG